MNGQLRTGRRIEAILFDVVGTLFDSAEAFYMLVRDIFNERGWPLAKREEIVSLIGKTNLEIAMVLLPEHVRRDERALMDSVREMESRWIERYLPNYVKLAESATFVLNELRSSGFKLGIVSNGSSMEIPLYLKEGGVEKFFQVVVTADDVKRPKPSPDPILLAARKLGVPPSRILYVGDTVMDAKSARAAGTFLALILSGIGKRDELLEANPDLLIETLRELPTAISKFSREYRE